MEKEFKEFKKSLNRYSSSQRTIIDKAFEIASERHRDQKRRSGEPYIIHPLKVATYLAKDGHDYISVASALIHDLIEDTDTKISEVSELFGAEIAKIVEGVTKISSIKIKDKKRIFSDNDLYLARVDNYRKILLATISDLRVIMIKLYDRLHNIETVEFLPKEKQKFYARETIEIFAPIAERMGMGETKGKLEDFAFPYAFSEEYEDFIHTYESAYKNPAAVINNVIPTVEKNLDQSGVFFHSVSGRAKHLYSLFVKLKKNNKNISEIFDIVALRVIVDSVEDCYKTLGIIHSIYKPIPGRIFDYIARPKPSGYQSIHTTVKDSKNNVFEIQIRTQDMHELAEYGPAAHWNYKEGHDLKNANVWIEELKKIEEIKNGKDFIKTLKEELFSKRVFAFTPKGDIIDLPSGSCGIDFAYFIHSEVGNRCKGVKINGRLMPLKTPLETGDVVDIIKSPSAKPSKDWLKFVRTSSAKYKINHALRELNFDKYLKAGKDIFDKEISAQNLNEIEKSQADRKIEKSEIPYNNMDDALVAIGEKHLSKMKVLRILYPQRFKEKRPLKRNTSLNFDRTIESIKNIRHSFAGCCKPKKKDSVIGYLSREHIIKIHKIDCRRIASANKDRLIKL